MSIGLKHFGTPDKRPPELPKPIADINLLGSNCAAHMAHGGRGTALSLSNTRASYKTYLDYQNTIRRTDSLDVDRLKKMGCTIGVNFDMSKKVQNLCLQSETFNTGWVVYHSSIVVDNTIAPDGETTADTLHEDATVASPHYVYYSSVIPVDGGSYVLQVFAKKDNRDWISLGEGSGGQQTYFDLTNGVVGTSTADDEGIVDFGDDWYLCWMAITQSGSGTLVIYIAEADNDVTFNGLNQDSLYVWGAQVTATPVPVPYVHTTTVAKSCVFNDTINMNSTCNNAQALGTRGGWNHITLSADAMYDTTQGRYGNALINDGGVSGNYGLIADGRDVNANGARKITVSAWVDTASLGEGTFGRILDKASGYQLYSGIVDELVFVVWDGAALRYDRTSDSPLAGFTGVHLITAVFDGTLGDVNDRIKIYFDGVLRTMWNGVTATIPSEITDAGNGLYMLDNAGNTAGYDGILHSLSITPHYAMSAAEAKELYNRGSWAMIRDEGMMEFCGSIYDFQQRVKNHVLRSEEFDNGSWIKVAGSTSTANDMIAPDGTLTADRLTVVGVVANEYVYQVFAETGDGTYCAQVFLKVGTTTGFTLALYDATAVAFRARVDFTWVAGVLSVAAEDHGYGGVVDLTTMAPGWYMAWVVGSGVLAANANWHVCYPSRQDATEAGYIYAWGAQTTKSSVPRPYVNTVAAQRIATFDAGVGYFTHYLGTRAGSNACMDLETVGGAASDSLWNNDGWYGENIENDGGVTNDVGLVAHDWRNNIDGLRRYTIVGWAQLASIGEGGAGYFLSKASGIILRGQTVDELGFYVYDGAAFRNYSTNDSPWAGFAGWHQFICVFDEGVIAIYFDAAARTVVDGGNVPHSISDAGNTLYVTDQAANNSAIDGHAGAIALLPNVALTATQVEELYGENTMNLGPQGLNPEVAETNVLLHSNQFDDGDWTAGNVMAAQNAIENPQGKATACKLIEDTNNATHYVYQVPTVGDGTPCTHFAYFKAAERTWVFIRTRCKAGVWRVTYFNLATGVVGTDGHTRSGIETKRDGWYFCWVSHSSNAGAPIFTSGRGITTADNTLSYVGDGKSGAYVSCAQVEERDHTTSYTPTRETTITRAADSIYYASAGNLLTAQGSVYVELEMGYDNDELTAATFQWNAYGNDDNMLNFSYSDADNKFYFRKRIGGVSKAGASLAQTFSKGAVYRLIGTYGSTGVRIYTNGLLGATVNSDTADAVFGANVYVGRFGGAAGYEAASSLRRITTFPRQLTQSQVSLIEQHGLNNALRMFT